MEKKKDEVLQKPLCHRASVALPSGQGIDGVPKITFIRPNCIEGVCAIWDLERGCCSDHARSRNRLPKDLETVLGGFQTALERLVSRPESAA